MDILEYKDIDRKLGLLLLTASFLTENRGNCRFEDDLASADSVSVTFRSLKTEMPHSFCGCDRTTDSTADAPQISREVTFTTL